MASVVLLFMFVLNSSDYYPKQRLLMSDKNVVIYVLIVVACDYVVFSRYFLNS